MNTTVPPHQTRRSGRPAPQARLATLPQLRFWILWPAAMSVFVVALGLSAKLVPGITTGELGVDQDLSRHHDGFLNVLAMSVNYIFAPVGGAIILVLLCLYLLIVRRSPVNAIAVGAVTAVGWMSSQVFKMIVERQRPNPAALFDPLAPETGSNSFPSGHTCLAVALALALYFLARNTHWEKFAIVAGILVPVGVAASRIYVGVHYPTDVIASFFAATAAVLFFAGLWNRYALRMLNRIPLLARFGPVPAPDAGARGSAANAGTTAPAPAPAPENAPGSLPGHGE